MNSLPIIASFLIALVLASLPLPDSVIIFRPEWLMLVLIYWCMALPERIGIFSGWSLGLMVDVMYGSLLGQNAMSFALVAYFVGILHLRVRMFPLWQQSLMVLVLVSLHLALNAWVRGLAGQFSISWSYWMPALISAVVWPILFIVLRDLRRQHVSR